MLQRRPAVVDPSEMKRVRFAESEFERSYRVSKGDIITVVQTYLLSHRGHVIQSQNQKAKNTKNALTTRFHFFTTSPLRAADKMRCRQQRYEYSPAERVTSMAALLFINLFFRKHSKLIQRSSST